MTNFLFIDFDGVINAFHHDHIRHKRTNLTCAGDSYKINYDPAIVYAINKLSRAGVVVVWLTTWVDGANNSVFDSLGFDRFPFIGKVDRDVTWWKWNVLKETILDTAWFMPDGPYSKVVWIDDDLGSVTRMEAMDWSSSDSPHNPVTNFLARENVMGISPPSNNGITLTDIETIKTFLELS